MIGERVTLVLLNHQFGVGANSIHPRQYRKVRGCCHPPPIDLTPTGDSERAMDARGLRRGRRRSNSISVPSEGGDRLLPTMTVAEGFSTGTVLTDQPTFEIPVFFLRSAPPEPAAPPTPLWTPCTILRGRHAFGGGIVVPGAPGHKYSRDRGSVAVGPLWRRTALLRAARHRSH